MRLFNGVRFPIDRPCLENECIIDHGCMPMIEAMMTGGIYIDKEYLFEFAIWLKGEEDRVTGLVTEMVGRRLNLASKDQVADLLFRYLNIKPRFRLEITPSGKREVINDKVLESLKDYHPVVPLLQEFDSYNKLRTSFAETLPLQADIAGRIHGTIKQTRVITGRLAMTDPNLMGIPTRTKLGKRIKKSFKAPPSRWLGEIDLSQSQMRLVAHISGCENMINIFLAGGDIHRETAARMFRLRLDQVEEMKHRYPAKRAGFGVVFLITGAGFQAQMHAVSDDEWTRAQREEHIEYWTIGRCNQTLVDWYDVNSEVRTMQNHYITMCRRHGMVWDPLFGRVRSTPGIRSTQKYIKMDAEREAGNSPIVMAEVGIMKIWMAKIWAIMKKEKWDCKPLVQVHDALVWDGDKYMPEYLARMQYEVANLVPLDVPMNSDFKFGEGSWGDLK